MRQYTAPGMLRIEFETDGRIKIAPKQPSWILTTKGKK
jgi:hypothetical protein